MKKAVRRIAIAGLLLSAMSVSGSGLAQSYPAKAIRMVVPYSPGGGTDIVGRALAQEVGKALQQQMVKRLLRIL